jgi:putative endonuclease
MPSYFVYLIQCEDKSIYTGITTDLKRRFKEHQNKTGANYTRAHKVKKILFSEKHIDRSNALKREAEIKSWPRKKKLALISSK